MTTALSGISAGGTVLPAAEPSPRRDEPGLHNLWGLLTVRGDNEPDARHSAQLEAALRIIDGTDIGASLLRALSSCDIPVHERPLIAFVNLDSHRDAALLLDDGSEDDERIIHFGVQWPSVPTDAPFTDSSSYPFDDLLPDELSQRYQAVDLFADLATFFADHTGRPCLAPSLGCVEYSALTFREQLGDEIPSWQYSMEAYLRAPAEAGEKRATVWELVNLWNDANKPEQPLQLNSLDLRECPPLRELPGLTWLILADNALTAFPPSNRLPPTLDRLDLAGNPIAVPPDDYSPGLRHLTLDRTVCDNAGLRAGLPPAVELEEVDADYVESFRAANRFVTEFPETLVGMVPVEEMERAGWSNDVMARLYPKDALEKAAAKWFAPSLSGDIPQAPARAGDAWRRAQGADPNGAAALSALIDRLHAAWSRRPDPVFHQRFAALLAKMCQPGNDQFRDECLSIAREGAASCNDQILYTLNNLHIASLNADVAAGAYDRKPAELMHHAEDMLNVHTLTQFFADLRPELQRRARERHMEFEEVEQWLHLHTRLQGSVHLPDMQFGMQFVNLSLVTDADARAARARIAEARNKGYLEFLAVWAPLQSVIRRVAPRLTERAGQWREHIVNDRGRFYGALDRLMKTDGQLFAAPRQSGMDVFRVGPRMFWTRFERLVHEHLRTIDKRLATAALQRKTIDAPPSGAVDEDLDELRAVMQYTLPQVCRAVNDTIQRLIQVATARDFLNMHGLKLEETIQEAKQPRWFKRLRQEIP